MKLSIAILSPILLACSVTAANPVLDSSTTSTATTTSSAYPSATETSGTSHLTPLDPYSLHMDNCHPIGIDGITLIELLASNAHKLEKLSRYIDTKRETISEQKKVIDELKEKIDHLKSKPSGRRSEIIKLESTLAEYIKALGNPKRQLRRLTKEHSDTNQQNVQTRAMLGEYFAKHHSVGSTNSDGTINTEPYPGFTKCFDYFYYRSPQ
ncbi:hypothetical protein BATDEDRAFT_28232 [Batrachochytrium dendrobatidis JAM81]|uniref:Uncharacterized protein n=1 Tax=Batrachochytrium dendrobatidis (strain JAM81 / FGSC 10211) TaxID=684364 RepID=F4PDD3_BATDJ|nr:uncharacterized protein BATDEDRAFT_28232 [Batrachochytrium dendrobatidis JAM81]EGF76769.1 hypothetical protein BATDEDRAFT_28232 [Batrachochytrium dendrobatidis JAM81]|eukprot:XP_006682599.1 hypothetical protein BATDEDRAFT_28232 [Batrachochytrium dendrobatidis JAM81]